MPSQGKHPTTGVGIHPASEVEKLYADFYNHLHNRATHERYNIVLKDDFVVPVAPQDEFELSGSPYSLEFILVFLNGALQKEDDSYTISGKVITFNRLLNEDEYVTIIYKPCWAERDNNVTTHAQVDFPLIPDPNVTNAVYILVFRNGVLQMEDFDYLLSSTDVSFINPLVLDQYVNLLYRPGWSKRDDFVSSTGQTQFNLTSQSANCGVMVYRNGIIQWPGNDYNYSEVTNAVIFTSPLGDGEFISVIYRISS